MKTIKQIITFFALAIFILSSCTSKSHEYETLKLQEINFDLKEYQKNLSHIKMNNLNSFKSFEAYKNNLINSNMKSNYNFTEDDLNNAESILIDMGVFDSDVSVSKIVQNATNFLYLNNNISNETRIFLNDQFLVINDTIDLSNITINIQNYLDNNNLTTIEIDYLNSYLSFLDTDAKFRWGCMVAGVVGGVIVGTVASACCTPVVGAIAGDVAGSVIENVCNGIADNT